MKNKINTDYSKKFIGVKLFREDFENILSLAKKTLQQVEIHDSTNMYENLDEVITHKGQNPKEISITGRNRDFSLEYFSFDVKNDYASIYSRGSEKMYSFGLEIAELIKKKEDKYYTTLKPHNLLYITFLASTSLILFIDKETKTLSQPWLLWFVGVLGLLTLFSYFYQYLWVGLTLVRRHKYGFWNRNKDKIILALFGIIAGSIITLLIQLVSSK